MSTSIKVENLSKIYRLGEIGTGTISRDLERWFAKVRGKEDPFLKIGQTNDRSKKGESDIVYSLQDINFEIDQGDAVGIIGRNGAGKSTLLKILSRVTSPSTGRINIKGRVASLLEVGTGFHPELTGRENIFLNGAILGMRKKEIQRKLDEIIDFSGVERYIDTPVKRYSSGMYVRLAFAVAAHLESEILIVDEVLAVGDAEFQKKCLGKMNDVSKGEGRTVLFVSHNMASIENLCRSSILLENGRVKNIGTVDEVTQEYLLTNSNNVKKANLNKITDRKGNNSLIITECNLIQNNKKCEYYLESLIPTTIELNYSIPGKDDFFDVLIDIGINDNKEQRIAIISTSLKQDFKHTQNSNKVRFEITNFNLSPGEYNLSIFCKVNGEISDWLSNVVPFFIVEKDYHGSGKTLSQSKGPLLLTFNIDN
jgi:lipopolysaccharide transport system ATP-binding protein